MSTTTPAIRSVKARAVIAPISRPVKNAFGVIEAAPLVLIDVETDQGVTGRSYIFAYAKLTLKPLLHLIEEIGRDLVGQAIAPFDLMAKMDAKFRLLSWQGLVGMAVSGLDMAYWDALGQIAGRPLADLLGGSLRPAGLRARPEIARVRLLLFIAGTVGFLDERKTPRFVKPARAQIALKRPELEAIACALCDLLPTPHPCTSGSTYNWSIQSLRKAMIPVIAPPSNAPQSAQRVNIRSR